MELRFCYDSNNHSKRVEDLLAKNITRISMQQEASKVVVFLVDKLSRKKAELKGVKIKVKLLGEGKDYLNKYIKIADKYPTCDYAHVQTTSDGIVIHLVEQTDLRASFENKKLYGIRHELREQIERCRSKRARSGMKYGLACLKI